MKFFRIVLLSLCLAALSVPVMLQAQVRSSLTPDADRLFTPDAASSSLASPAPSGFPTDNPIHPDYYYVGAGDVMTLEIVGPVALTVPIVVSPENTILLPRFGEVIGAGKTLTQVRSEIQRLVQARNPNNRAFLTLQRARTVYVRITGNVAQAGLYTLPASLRVSTAVKIANLENAPQSAARQSFQSTEGRKNTGFVSESAPSGQYAIPFPERNVKILHRDGRAEIGDAVRSRLMNDAAADPCLREGDEIYVPYDHEAGEAVSVAGEVQRPCLVPFRKGDKISLLLKAGFGLTENADSNNIQVLEAVSAGSGVESAQKLALRDILSGASDISLRGGMSVIVRRNDGIATEQGTKRRGTVTVVGEVKNPGVYAIEVGTTRIKSVLLQTGGFTANAHLPLSTLTRRENKGLSLGNSFSAAQAGMLPTGESFKNLQYSTLTPEDTVHFRMDEAMRRPTVACDIEAAMVKNSEADNVPLQDGDVIVIAQNPRNVYVFGHVQKPGFVEYTGEHDADWYIRTTGGYAAGADSARTRIIKAKNRLWLEPRITSGARKGETTLLEAGDQLYIPRVPDANTDLALKRVTADLQKQTLEYQQQNQTLQLILSVVGVVINGINSYFLITRPGQ